MRNIDADAVVHGGDADPRMKVTSYGGTKFLEVVDDTGNVLHSEADGSPQLWRRGRQGAQVDGASGSCRSRRSLGERIASVKGVVHLKVQVAETSVEVAEIDKNWKTPVTVGGRTVSLFSI